MNISSIDYMASSIISIVRLSSDEDTLYCCYRESEKSAKDFPSKNKFFKYALALTRLLKISQGVIFFIFGNSLLNRFRINRW